MGLFFAWMIGEGIITFRWIKQKAPPTPGALLLPSALFVALAILSEYRPARTVAVTFAYAIDLAILVNIVGKDPSVTTGWPPPKMLDTQIWPTKLAPAAAPATAATTSSSTTKPGNLVSAIGSALKTGFGLFGNP